MRDEPRREWVGDHVRRLGIRPLSLAAAIGVIILAVVLAWAAAAANDASNKRLLRLQVRQTASALGAAIPSIQTRLNVALVVADDTKSPTVFKRFASHAI